MKTFLSVVIPVYNEQRRIVDTLKYITNYLERQDYRYEIIVVNDGSKDKTSQIIKGLNLPHLKLLSYEENRGKGYAVNYGVLRAVGDVIMFCDADNATPFEQIIKLIAEIDRYPVVIGSRYIKGSNIKLKQPFIRRIMSRLGNLLIQAIVLPGYNDTQCGFKMFRAEVAREIFRRQTIWRWGFDMEILLIARSLKYPIRQVPVDWIDHHDSRLQTSSVLWKTLGELWRIKTKQLLGQYK